MYSRIRHFVAGVLVICLALPLPAQAGMIRTDAGGRDRVNLLLERADVQSRLQAYGVSAAGEGIIGALLIVFIVLLITDILGFTKVFPFTKPVK